MRGFFPNLKSVLYGHTKTSVNTARHLMFKMKQERKKRFPTQPSHLAKMSFIIRVNTVAYIWERLLTAAVELSNIMDSEWQSNGDTHWLDEPIPTETEDLLVDPDDLINNDMEYKYGDEVKSDNQQDELWQNIS